MDLLSSLAERASRLAVDDDTPDPPRRTAARWCDRCGAPRNLGRRECPGCRLLAESRERIVTHLARHGMPSGGAVELARLAQVPLSAVGQLMAPVDEFQGISRTAR